MLLKSILDSRMLVRNFSTKYILNNIFKKNTHTFKRHDANIILHRLFTLCIHKHVIFLFTNCAEQQLIKAKYIFAQEPYNLCDFCFVTFQLHWMHLNFMFQPVTEYRWLEHHHGQDVSGVSAGLPQDILLHSLQSTPGKSRRTYIQGIVY